MKKTIIVVAILIVAAAAYGAITLSKLYFPPTPPAPPTDSNVPVAPVASTSPAKISVRAATSSEIAAVVKANNQFSFDLYSRYKTTQAGKNIFYSPYSITTALGMTYEGARGTTATEMQKTLHIPQNADSRKAANASIIASLNKGSSSFTLKTANALWAEKTFPFLPDFIGTVGSYFGGSVTNLDFKNTPDTARTTINSWVSDQTNKKITDLIPSGAITDATRMVLTNAIYFKGTWVIQFDKSQTKPADFTLASGAKVSAPLMSLSGEKAVFGYAENDLEQVISLPYKGDRLSMWVILPKASTMKAVESSLSANSIAVLSKSMSKQRVILYLPKFTFKTTYQMADDLTALGMPTAFTGAADFSGMDGQKDLQISQVIHQAFIDVNEEGTEAAAATAVIMKTTAIYNPKPIPEFRADHPFVFLIQDNLTGDILFMGKVMDPTAK